MFGFWSGRLGLAWGYWVVFGGRAVLFGWIDVFFFLWIYDYISCDYELNADNVKHAFNEWTSIPADKIFLGLPAAKEAAETGYISPDELYNEEFPDIKPNPKFGGVMLWNRYYDKNSNYSAAIKPHLELLDGVISSF